MSDPREGEEFPLNVPEKPDNPFPDLKYFREHGNLIGNALDLLLTHPDELAKLRGNPALMHNVIEETLRYGPPVTQIPRALPSETLSCTETPFGKGNWRT
jgi:cytochrome P450